MAKNKIKTKLEIVVLLLIVITGLIAILIVNSAEKYKFTDAATFYIDGTEYEITKGSYAKFDKETETIYLDVDKDEKMYSRGLPAYYNDTKKIVLLNNMLVITPRDTFFDVNRLMYYTVLENDSDVSGSKISRNNSFAYQNKGFLFDGNNTYVFLEPVSLKFNDTILRLGTFSYIISAKENYLQVYDIDTGFFNIYFSTELLNATINGTNSNFVLYPEVDYVTIPSGTGMLLTSNVEGSNLLK